MQELEIGTILCMTAVVLGTCFILGGVKIMPLQVRMTILALIMIFVGYQAIEFIGLNFVAVSK